MSLCVTSSLGRIVDVAAGTEHSSEKLLKAIFHKRNAFYHIGLRRGDKAILCHANRTEFFIDLLALWEVGVCAIPVDPSISISELENLIQHSDARLVLYHNKEIPPSFNPPAQMIRSDDLNPHETTGNLTKFQDQNAQWEDAALMLYTSGSTGEPKGVLHTFRSLMARIYLLRGHVNLNRLERSLNLLPTHFGHGLICNCLYPLLNGQTLVLLPSFNLELISKLGNVIDDYGVTFMSSVPTVWKMALKFSEAPKKKTLKMIHCGSAPLSSNLHQEICDWAQIKNVKNTYGITETGSWLAGTEDNKTNFFDGYIGKGWGSDLLIVPEQESPGENSGVFQSLPAGKEGMVWVKTPALMKEYYKRPDLTEEAIQNTWFYTGDIGYLDKENHLVLVGRKRHEINKAGMKIYPEDIDLALERNKDVAEACCFAMDDKISGQSVGVAVVPKNPDQMKLAEVKKWLQNNISPQKFPSKWFVVPKIPRTSRGKINRETVARACMEPKTHAVR